jgi:hypothetical protein
VINWPVIKQTAHDVITDLTGAKVIWSDESQGGIWEQGAIIYARISALKGSGIPEEDREPNGTDDQTVTMVAQKTFTLSLRCETFNQDLGSGKHAGDIMERLKTRLKRTSTIERLRGIFAVQEELATNRFSYASQGRQVSCYVLDLGCATVDVDTDDTEDAGGFINRVHSFSHYTENNDGTNTKTQVDVDVRGDA